MYVCMLKCKTEREDNIKTIKSIILQTKDLKEK